MLGLNLWTSSRLGLPPSSRLAASQCRVLVAAGAAPSASSAIVWIRQQRPAPTRSRVEAEAGGPNGSRRRTMPFDIWSDLALVRRCAGHLDWSRSRVAGEVPLAVVKGFHTLLNQSKVPID